MSEKNKAMWLSIYRGFSTLVGACIPVVLYFVTNIYSMLFAFNSRLATIEERLDNHDKSIVEGRLGLESNGRLDIDEHNAIRSDLNHLRDVYVMPLYGMTPSSIKQVKK